MALALCAAGCMRPDIDPAPYRTTCMTSPDTCPAPYRCVETLPASGPPRDACLQPCDDDNECPKDFSCNKTGNEQDFEVPPGFCYASS